MLVLGVIGRVWQRFGASSVSLIDNALFAVLMVAAVLCYGWVGYRAFEKLVLERTNAFARKRFGRDTLGPESVDR